MAYVDFQLKQIKLNFVLRTFFFFWSVTAHGEIIETLLFLEALCREN